MLRGLKNWFLWRHPFTNKTYVNVNKLYLSSFVPFVYFFMWAGSCGPASTFLCKKKYAPGYIWFFFTTRNKSTKNANDSKKKPKLPFSHRYSSSYGHVWYVCGMSVNPKIAQIIRTGRKMAYHILLRWKPGFIQLVYDIQVHHSFITFISCILWQ